jgi:uncharacterized protein (DUF58 family)
MALLGNLRRRVREIAPLARSRAAASAPAARSSRAGDSDAASSARTSVPARDDQAERPTLLAPELMARVRQIKIRTHRLVNTALSGGYRSTFRGSGIEFQEVRAYQPGDEVRRIDWNVTARTGEAFVKTYAEERELTLNFIVDTSRSMDFGSRQWTKREAAAQFCALISLVALQHQDRVGLVLFGGEPGLHLPSRKGGQHVLRVVREVIAAPPTDGGSDFGAVLEHQARVLRRRSIVFLVSDFIAGEKTTASKPWTEWLARLAQRHDVIAVRVTDPFEVDVPRAGLIGMREIESGRTTELDTRSRAVREAWNASARSRRSETNALLLRARTDVIDLDTSKDIGEPVLSFFRKRMLRHGGGR